MRNRIRLVVFDWAGTVVDFGSRAPTIAFQRVFAEFGIEVSESAANGPMGLNKRDHLIELLNLPAVAEQWSQRFDREWEAGDVDKLYDAFTHAQLESISSHADLVPELLPVVQSLRERGIKIGGSTGYFRAAAEAVATKAAGAGYSPDANVCADDVPAGRPAPWMIFRLMEALDIYPSTSVLKIGDTVADIRAGLAAGCWSVGICDSSSIVGKSHRDWCEIAESDRSTLLERAAVTFRDVGAHAVMRTIGELPALIDQIEMLGGSSPQVLAAESKTS